MPTKYFRLNNDIKPVGCPVVATKGTILTAELRKNFYGNIDGEFTTPDGFKFKATIADRNLTELTPLEVMREIKYGR